MFTYFKLFTFWHTIVFVYNGVICKICEYHIIKQCCWSFNTSKLFSLNVESVAHENSISLAKITSEHRVVTKCLCVSGWFIHSVKMCKLHLMSSTISFRRTIWFIFINWTCYITLCQLHTVRPITPPSFMAATHSYFACVPVTSDRDQMMSHAIS